MHEQDQTTDGRFLLIGERPWGDPVVLGGAATRYLAQKQAEGFRAGGLEGYATIRVEDTRRKGVPP